MKAHFVLACLACILFFQVKAQQPAETTIYPVVVQFQSECCGVPDDAPLRRFIKSFKKQQKIKKIIAYHIGPMGREGEYYLAFPLKELNKKQKTTFIRKLKTVTKNLKDKGMATCVEKMKIEKQELPGMATFEKQAF